MGNILDILQVRINNGECGDLYNAEMRFVPKVKADVRCRLCSAVIGERGRGLVSAYRTEGESPSWLCEKCFSDFRDALDLTKTKE